MNMKLFACGVLVWAATGTVLAADGLYDIYLKALRNDADFASASASNEATREEGAKGRAGLLPTVSISGTQTHNQTDQRSLTFLGMRSQDYKYTSSNYGISMRQPLYRPYNWAGYLQGQARVSYGEAVLASAKQDLVLRAAGAYLDVLLAGEGVSLTRAQKAALTEQLALTKAQFLRGEGSKTDINDAQARYDMTVAQELEALNSLENNKRALERITGESPTTLRGLAGNNPPPQSPEPNDVKQWIEWALQSNPTIQAQRFGVEITTQDVARASADHKPTLDLIASRSKSDSENNVSINTRYDTSAVGVQLSIPLFSGGYVSANVRQAEAKKRQAQQDLESTQRKVTLETRQNFNNLITGIAQIKAYEQAVASNETALESTRKSVKAGMRSNVDILNAQQQLYSSKRDLARSRYQYIINWLKLKSSVGTLGDDDVQMASSWLSAPPATE